MTKLAIVGAGSSYTPLLIDHILNSGLDQAVSEVCLMDIDAGRLKAVHGFTQRLAEKSKSKLKIKATLNLNEAVKGAKIVVPQIRVGMMAARRRDEELGRRYGIIGQETTGVGGFSKALRTIPQIRRIADALLRYGAKDPWLVNFTNPVGIVTEALVRFHDIRAVGICNGSLTMHKGVSDLLGASMEDTEIDYVGPNHFAWVLDVRRNGRSVLGPVIKKMIEQEGLPTALNITKVKLTPEIMRRAGIIPTGYHKYFFHSGAVVKEDKTTPSRAAKVAEIERRIFAAYRSPSVSEIPEAVKERGGAFYNVVAYDVIACLLGLQKKRVTVAVPNNGTYDGFERDHVLEMPCLIDKSGYKPLKTAQLPVFARGLSQRIKAYEALTAEAAWKCDFDLAYQALLLNPLTPDADVTFRLLKAVLAQNRDFLPPYKGAR
ncbi:MAG: family 4 glycosyl hydrolase [Elusimicrobiales bacterium]